MAMRVLVIEDEEKMADLIRRGLEEEGMAVELAYTAKADCAQGKPARTISSFSI